MDPERLTPSVSDSEMGRAIAATPELGLQGHADALRLTGSLAPSASGSTYLDFAEGTVDPRTA